MKYKTRYRVGRQYICLDPEATISLDLHKDVSTEFLKEHSYEVTAKKVTSLIISINHTIMHFTTVGESDRVLNPMTLFGEGTVRAEKFEDVSVYRSIDEAVHTSQLCSDSTSLHNLRMYDFNSSEGLGYSLPDDLEQQDDEQVQLGYLIVEKNSTDCAWLASVRVPISEYQSLCEALEESEDEYQTIKDFRLTITCGSYVARTGTLLNLLM